MRVWQTLLGRRDEISRLDLSGYLGLINEPHVLLAPSSTRGDLAEGPTADYQHMVRQAYQANGVVFGIVLARLLLFSEARFLFRRLRGGRRADMFGTSALRLLEQPWPNGTTGELLARMEQDVSLSGNAFIVGEGDRLRRLRPDWVEIVLTAPPEEATEVDVAGYAYTPGGPGRGEAQMFLPGEVCHWSPIPDPLALYRGMSWLSPVMTEVQADDAATRHKLGFFRNGARPGLVVSVKEGVTPEQFRKFVAANELAHRGVDNAYKTLYIAGGADITTAGTDLRQLDFRATQGAGETRLCAAGGVPPIIVGLSEGLASATYSNYASARRKFGDHWARPQWRSVCAALSTLIDVPGDAELWYDDSDIAFLREDQKDAAEIQQIKASTITMLVREGFTAESAVAAVDGDDRSLLKHTGMTSVQLQAPGTGPGTQPGDRSPANGSAATVPEDADAVENIDDVDYGLFGI